MREIIRGEGLKSRLTASRSASSRRLRAGWCVEGISRSERGEVGRSKAWRRKTKWGGGVNLRTSETHPRGLSVTLALEKVAERGKWARPRETSDVTDLPRDDQEIQSLFSLCRALITSFDLPSCDTPGESFH